mgnify:CR=1 FL=1
MNVKQASSNASCFTQVAIYAFVSITFFMTGKFENESSFLTNTRINYHYLRKKLLSIFYCRKMCEMYANLFFTTRIFPQTQRNINTRGGKKSYMYIRYNDTFNIVIVRTCTRYREQKHLRYPMYK